MTTLGFTLGGRRVPQPTHKGEPTGDSAVLRPPSPIPAKAGIGLLPRTEDDSDIVVPMTMERRHTASFRENF